MKYSNTVEYNINTKLDSSGLTKLQAQIKQLENSMQQMANRELLNSDKVQAAKTQLEGLNTALTNSFNSSLGILDLSKFRAELDAGGVSAKGLQSAFNMMGAEGQAALNGLTTQIANFNGGMERTSSQIDKIFTTFSNTFRWGLVSSFFSQFMNAIHSSVDYVKELDDSLTQIMLVTDYNRNSMNEFAKSANEAAKAVSMTTTGMTNASLIFAQQGYDLGQSQELATLSAKVANASQQDTATTSDQITAYMNAYGLENNIAELTQAMDNWALIANISAADVGELAQASQRAASMANAVGVNGEQLAAQIATIESVTREAPEQIGNGLKTLYARFSDIAAGGEDEDGFTLGKVTSQLQAIGVQIFDQMGQIRDVGDIMEDLMVIWDDLDQTSKVAASQALAGKYQVNRFMALMDNNDMYQEYKGATGSAATGTLDTMNEEYAQSIEGRSARLQASLEGLFSTIFNTDDIYPWMDAAQGAVDLLQQFFDALGGGKTVLLGITALLTQAFSQNMARSINDMVANRNLGKIREQNIATVGDTLDRAGIDRSQGIGKYIDNTANQAKLGALSDAQYDTYMNNVQQWANAQTALTQAQEELTDTINVVNMVYGKATKNKNAIFNDEGGLNTQLANEERANLSDRQLNRLMQDTDFSDVAEKAKEFSQSLQNVEQQIKAVDADSENYEKQMNSLANAIDLAGDKLAEFDALNVASDDMIESILSDLTSLEGKIRANGGASDEAEKEIAELISMIGRLGKSAKDMSPQAFKQAILGGGDVVDKKKGNVDFAQTQTNRAEENALDAQKNIDSQQQIKGILDTLNAVQQLTFAWQAFQNLGSLWTNEDLSTGEKVLQTIMNLTMAIPQLITAMDTLKGNDFLKNIGENLLQSLDFSKNGQKGIAAKQQFDELVAAATKGREAMKDLENVGKHMSNEIVQGLEKTVAEGALAEDALTKIGPELLETSMVGTTGLEAIKTSLAGLATSAKAFLAEFWPLLLIGTAVAGISALIGAAQEQAEQAHQEAISALEDAKNAQQEIQNLSSSIGEWESKRNSQGENKKLAQEADELSKTMQELGANEQASSVHLAALRAEANNTAENFDILAQAINNAQTEMNNQAYLNTMNAANEILKDQLSTEEEIVAAREDMKNAALDYNLNQISQVNGSNMGILGVVGDSDLRAATADWQSLDALLKEAVPGFSEITDENERLALALSHTSDEAQRAAIEIQQVLNANENLNGSARDTGGVLNQRDSITRQLQTAGFSAQESLQLLATLDKDASMAEISERIAEIQSEMELNGNDFDLALKGTLSEEDAAELTKNQISSFEAIDEDIDTEAMRDLAEYIRVNAEELDDFSNSVALDAEELAELSEEILRYDDALQTAQDSMEDWEDMLTSGATQDAAEATKQLVDTYNDLLDVGEGASISTDFAGDIDNLNLLKAAIEGDEEAYTELQHKAAEDIVLNIATNDEVAQAAFDKVWDMINEVDGYYASAEVGAELDNADFIAALEEMINAAGMTADQATAALSAMGVDAEIESQTETEETPATAIGLTAVPYTESVEGQFPVANLGTTAGGANISLPTTESFTATFPAVRYEPQEVDASSTLAMTGFSLKTTSGGKSSGGNLSIKSAKKGNTGGSKFRNASHGGGASGGRGGGGGGKSCFVAGTLVSTSLGFRPIEQIQKGDIVLSYNKLFRLNEYSEVLQTMIHDTIEPIYTLYIKDEQLRVTGIHRFLVTDKITFGVPQWVHAADLKVGQWVLFADGTWHVIHKIEVNVEHQIVYNFEVSGNHNYYVGRNQILAHNKGGGKKGGSGGKAKTIEQKEKKNHEKDYYEEVDTQLEKVEKELSRIEKQQDKLTGDKARANQNKQLSLLQKQIELQKEHLRILTEEEKVDVTKHLKEQDKQAEKLIQKYSKLFVIPNPVYDEDGIISNYEQISKAIDDAHNKMIDEYNKAAKTGNEELTKQIQKDIDNLDKYGDAIRKDAQRINDITVEVEELNNTIQDLRDSMQDIRIDAFKQAVEARDGLKSIKEIAAEVNAVFREFDPDSFINSFSIDETPYENLLETMGKLDNIYNVTAEDAGKFYDDLIKQKQAALDKATDADEKAAIEQSIEFFTARKNNLSEDNLMNGYIGVLQDDLATLQEWMDNPESPENIFGTDTAALQEMFQETYEKLGDAFNEYRELIQDYRDSILDIYDEAEEAIDRQMDKYDNLTDKIKRMSDTYALYYGEDSYAELDKFYAQQGEIMQNQLNQLKEAYAYWQQQYQEVLATGDKKLIQEIEDKMTDAEKAMLEKAEELADLWVEKFENIVEANTQSIYDKLFNGNNFNDLTDSWELQKDYMERYKDEVEKSYEIDKLRSKYIDLLNDSQGASLQTQNKIRQQMQEQLKQLQDQATVSEYDVKLANARLEILQKQIALEDAQRNKNQMQLRRDSQGNYRYTYRANQKDVKAAQDDLLDSEFNAYELTKNETISNNDRALNMVQDFLNKRADIFNKYKDDDEARTKALAQLSADYSQLLGGLEEDFKDTTNGMYDVLTFMVQNGTEDSATAAAEMLDNLFESEGVFKDNTEVLWASMADDVTGMLEKFENTVEEANNEMLAQVEDLRTKMTGSDGALTTIGSSADVMKSSLDGAAEATINLREETDALYDLFSADDGRLQNALDKIKEYEQQLQSTQNTTSSLAQSLKKANATLATKTAEAQSYKTGLDLVTGARQVKEGTKVKLKKGTFVHYDRYGGVQQDSEGNVGWRLPDDMWVKFDAPATEKNATYRYGFYATGDSLTKFGPKQTGDSENGRQNTDQRRHQKWWFNDDELQKNVLAAMDTGGYTGDWEDNTSLYKNGKLALLHQKELVLNSSDTQNILSAVEIVRAIAAGINNQLTSISQNKGLFNFNSSMSSLGEEIQQRVEIKAEFPNVQDSYQIEQALLELSDRAYQYAHRNI